jgi:hypothetical protein
MCIMMGQAGDLGLSIRLHKVASSEGQEKAAEMLGA